MEQVNAVEPVATEQKKKSDFKQYYHSNPEFRQRHLEKSRERIICNVCGKMVPRSNFSAHTKSAKHKNIVREKLMESNKEFEYELKKAEDEYSQKVDEIMRKYSQLI